jgi:uncharacterized protein (TIGR03435 family)
MKRQLSIAYLFILLSCAGWSQDNRPQGSQLAAVPLTLSADKLPDFDVADLQVSKPGEQRRAQFLPGGRVQFKGMALKFMILAAWGFETDEGRVKGGPSWVNSDQYDIVAKSRPDATIANLRLMLRSLLIKRFGLEVHIEDSVLPVYGLERGKVDAKVKPSAEPGSPDCSQSLENDVVTMTCHNVTMDELANGLRGIAPAYVDKPVVNLTGLTGQYDFKFGWTPRGRLLGTGDGSSGADSSSRPEGAPTASDPTSGGITVFEAIDKYMGLKLNSMKHAIPVVVIDKINRQPLEN